MKKIKKTILLVIFYLIIMSAFSTVNATSASLSSNKKSMTVGDTAKITVTIKAAAWNITISGATSKSIVGYSDDGENTTETTTINFKPTSKGTYKINLSGDITDGTSLDTSTVSDSVTITVKEATESTNTSNSTSSNSSNNKSSSSESTTTKVSSNATLKNLGITPYKYDFSTFKPATTSYTVDVPYEAETINIYATTTSTKATVTGTGSKKLSVGKNTFNVKVTAEDKKTTKTYTLIINRQEEKVEEPKEEEPEDTIPTNSNIVTGLTNLNIVGYTISPEFNNDIYEYKLDVTDDLSKLEIQTETSNDSIKVDIVGNEEFEEGENVITILVYNPADDNTTTYQIIVNKDLSKTNLVDLNDLMSEAQNKIKKQKFIIEGTIAIIVILIIIYLLERYIIQKRQKEDDGLENIETIEYRLDKEQEHTKRASEKGKRFK